MFVQERLPNDITSLRIAEVSSIAVESLRKCQFQRLRAKVKHNVGFAIKYSWSRKDVVFRDGESFRLLLSDERLIWLSRFWVGKIGSMLKRRNKSNFALWRIGNVSGGAHSYAALSPPHRGWVKKREHHFRDTLFCVVPPGIVIYFQVVEYHSFLKATQP